MLTIISAAGVAFVPTGRLGLIAPLTARSSAAVPYMSESEYEKYMKSRKVGEVEKIQEDYLSVCHCNVTHARRTSDDALLFLAIPAVQRHRSRV